ncbi:MAG: hypothetical protein JXR05_15130 [Flavobacteriaceae bacterium]
MKKIVIIGNGFDLAHDLPTSYTDFIRFLIEESIRGNKEIRKDLIDVGYIATEDQSYSYIKENYKKIATTSISRTLPQKTIKVKNRFLFDLLNKFFSADWIDIEEYYFHILSLTPESVINQLNSDFEKIKEYLSIYLEKKAGYSSFIRVDNFKRIFLDDNPKEIIFLSFNYTDTIKHYYQSINIPKKLIFIHGKLKIKENPIVFGYGNDEAPIYKTVIDKNDNRYTRNLKRQLYNLAFPYNDLTSFLTDNTDILHIYTLGHSLGLTDKTLLKEVFENRYVEKIKMYYYKDIEGYRNLNDNLSRIVSSTTLNTKVVNFPDSEEIPQLINN